MHKFYKKLDEMTIDIFQCKMVWNEVKNGISKAYVQTSLKFSCV